MSESDHVHGSAMTPTVELHERRLMASATIMMVDDEPINMEVLKVHLEGEGYDRFVMIEDSRQALDAMRADPPDVLLLDLVMPEVSGFDILAGMRSDECLRRIPVLVLTSSNDAETKLAALQVGATDYLAKPVDPSELALRMRNTLASRAWQQRMADIDALTDLPNRRFFTSLLRDRLSRAAAPPTEVDSKSFAALVLVNINRFKAINDSLGPENGDLVLRVFSSRVVAALGRRSRLASDDLIDSRQLADHSLSCVARLGGDRFAVLLPLDEDESDGDALAGHLKRFAATADVPLSIAGEEIYLEVSIGVSTLSANTPSVEALVNDAETAMRHAQRQSGTAFAFYSAQMDARARELLSLENGLRTAVDAGEIFIVYQPKVDVFTGNVTGAEALVRWMNPEFGLISPVDFIPIAENNGMIVSIGAWVMQESCRQTREWHDKGHTHLCIAVNVSIRQLQEPDFMDVVRTALETSGLAPHALIVELTENMIMENAEANVVKLKELKALGIRLSIDDFGTGYSSLSYLQRFPLDQLKIDRSFIAEIDGVCSHAPIVKAVVSLAHDLGLTVVAEGIETHHQLAHVRAYGCEEYQGYFCSRPIPAEDFLAMVEGQCLKSA